MCRVDTSVAFLLYCVAVAGFFISRHFSPSPTKASEINSKHPINNKSIKQTTTQLQHLII